MRDTATPSNPQPQPTSPHRPAADRRPPGGEDHAQHHHSRVTRTPDHDRAHLKEVNTMRDAAAPE